MKRKLHLSWAHLILGIIGLALSAYSWHVHRLIKAGGNSGCDVTETISCDKVLASKYGEMFGVPLGLFGMVFFAIVLMTAFSQEADFHPRRFASTQLIVSIVGVLTSMALIYISKVLIGAYCPICMATHATTTLLFLFSVRAMFKSRDVGPSMARAPDAM